MDDLLLCVDTENWDTITDQDGLRVAATYGDDRQTRRLKAELYGKDIMTPLTRRKLIDMAVACSTFLALDLAGAGLWAMLIVPLGMWKYYDGMTRRELPHNAKG